MATSSVRVIQRGVGNAGNCLEITFYEEFTFLVNVPELMQRASTEMRVRLTKLAGLLFTQVTSGTFQGYPDLLMNTADLG